LRNKLRRRSGPTHELNESGRTRNEVHPHFRQWDRRLKVDVPPWRGQGGPCVDPNQAGDPCAHETGGLDHNAAPQGMADQDDPVEVQCLDDGQDILGERRDCPFRAPSPRLPVAGQIDAHDEMPFGEGLSLEIPVLATARPAVNKEKGGPAAASNVEGDLYPIGRKDPSPGH
jgi:hypothetical protein